MSTEVQNNTKHIKFFLITFDGDGDFSPDSKSKRHRAMAEDLDGIYIIKNKVEINQDEKVKCFEYFLEDLKKITK